MLKEKVNDITIWYDDSIDIEKAKLIVSNNYFLFLKELDENLVLSLVPTDEDVLYISDLDVYMYNTFEHIFHSERIKEAYASIPLENAYLAFLCRNYFNGNTRLINVNGALSDDDFNNIFGLIIPFLYFHENGDVDKYVKYMKYRDQDESLKIYMWLKEKCMYNTYNIVQEMIAEKIKNDSYFYNNFGNVLNVMYKEIIDNHSVDYDSFKLPIASKEKINKMFVGFLKMINAPKSWEDTFFKLLENYL